MATYLTETGWNGLTNGFWTDGADIVVDNNGGIVVDSKITVNTLTGHDSITGSGGYDDSKAGQKPLYFGFENFSVLIMEKGNNSITGVATSDGNTTTKEFVYGIYNEIGSSITMYGNNNSITGEAIGDAIGLTVTFGIFGIYNRTGTITIGDGNNNSITGIGKATVAIPNVESGIIGFQAGGIFNRQNATMSIGNGNKNSITGVGGYLNGIYNRGKLSMGDGNYNSITGTGISNGAYGILNQNYNLRISSFASPIITMGDGNNNSITGIAIAKGEGSDSVVGIFNEFGGVITIGNGNNNSITGTAKGINSVGIKNGGLTNDNPDYSTPTATISMGNGNNNSITGIAEGNDGIGILNKIGCVIQMGNGNDSLTGIGEDTGIVNDGIIKMGDGADKVIADGGFAGAGSLYLEGGNDYLKGFGSGNFYGGYGKDILELTQGTYTVGVSGTNVSFTKDGITMNTFDFEKLIAGNTQSNFGSLNNGQTITI
jgi:hypothetical protein